MGQAPMPANTTRDACASSSVEVLTGMDLKVSHSAGHFGNNVTKSRAEIVVSLGTTLFGDFNDLPWNDAKHQYLSPSVT